MAAFRAIGAMLILLGLLAPNLAAAFVGEGRGASQAELAVHEFGGDLDGGACSEDDEQLEELIDCGANLQARLDEPWAIGFLRRTEVRTTKQQCEELIADIWSRESCSAEGRECGTMIRGGLPGPGPKLARSSVSAHAGLLAVAVLAAPARRLAPTADERMPKLRDLSPPVPPPKLARQ